MGQLVCELCGKSDFLKQDGVFVCQGCGTKYSPEEAKKMLGKTESVTQQTPPAETEKKQSDAKETEKMYRKIPLDAMVKNLKRSGMEDTPYCDRSW